MTGIGWVADRRVRASIGPQLEALFLETVDTAQVSRSTLTALRPMALGLDLMTGKFGVSPEAIMSGSIAHYSKAVVANRQRLGT